MWAWWCCTPHGGRSRSSGELGRQVLGVQVVGDDLGRHAVEPAQVVDGLEERPVGGQVLEVADVVAGDDVGAERDRHRALQLGADGQDRPRRRRPASGSGSGA